jgi:hypothetical protein
VGREDRRTVASGVAEMNERVMDESKRIIDEATRKEIVLRLLGGVAIGLNCPSALSPPLAREYADADFIGLKKQAGKIKSLFTDLRYTPAKTFNAIHGDRRLLFYIPDSSKQVDVLLDVFHMCHEFDFRDRLTIHPVTLSISDLLITKLQVIKINDKDIRDMLCLLKDHEISDNDERGISRLYIAKLCSRDWGIYKTFTDTLDTISSSLNRYDLAQADRVAIGSRIRNLYNAIEQEPKSTGWKLRAKIGDKVRWYELPEEPHPVLASES